MAEREQFSIGELTLTGASNGFVAVLEKDSSGNVTRCKGATASLPSAAAGYAIGCEFTDTTTGNKYVNTGSATSCTFNSAETGTTETLAATGNNLATAADITADIVVVTGADATKAVSLPVPAVGKIVTVINSDASNALPVYPDAAGTQINALGAGNAFTITAGQTATFVCRTSTLWYVAAATDTISGLTASAAELNVNAGVTPGAVTASKTLVVDAQSSLDTVRARTNRTLGGTGVPGAASVQTEITKAVTAFSDTVAKDVFTVTVPNAVHAAVIEVDALGVLGAGGAVGAGEACRNVKYQVVVNRFTGAATVATVSAAIGGAAANSAGAGAVTSVVATVSAMTGAVGAQQTFTILFAITKNGGASDNHTLVAAAKVLNQNATGITIA